ncbi:carbohydrate ABC transporter permease [Cohnella zeiphila]|uniref:Sugar ABC transporter permease n=1 Tax=Cohnella zeiphila TaxID=2761120 RepID=A0A7X0SJY2_9BACL|nr:sugar ABC transporter permease [Cohnella zeiphila]MBB6731344.1 sugar ABC transporter permease [Cohnella zeiphila]
MSRTRKGALTRAETRFAVFSLTPVMLLFGLFSLIPIVWGIVLMFYEYNPLNLHSPFIGMDNFRRLLHDEVFLKSFRNTFRFVAIAIPANIVLTLSIAIGINQIRSRLWKNTFRTLFFLPVVAPIAGSAVVWTTMFNKDGMINIMLNMFGLQSVNWLGDPVTAMLSIILMTLWADIGYNIVIFMTGLDAIPDVFYEAARLDGASGLKAFRHITLPLLSRTSLFVLIMTTISYLQMFPQFKIMTNGEPRNETRVMALDIFDNAFTYMNMGYASAMAFVLLLIVLIITVLQIRLGRSGWEY